jgi:CRISPR-associated DxTHG motif protein
VENVPNGNTEEEIWEIFDILMENIKENDVIYFDITHSFRFLPMLAFITLNYSRYTKNTCVKGVFYGSIESFCQEKGITIKEIEKIPVSERIAPVIDLTNFIQLFDWVIGAKEFMTSLNYKTLEILSTQSVKKLNREVKEKNDFVKIRELRDLSFSIRDFSDDVLLCRGLNLVDSYKRLYKSLSDIKESNNSARKSLKPFKYITEKLNNMITYEDSNIRTYLKIVELCCQNNLIQQGLTILEESLITYILEKMNLNITEIAYREIPSKISYKLKKGEEISEDEVRFINALGKDIFLLLYDIAGIRNDINHCGFRKSASSCTSLKENLNYFLQKARNIIESID